MIFVLRYPLLDNLPAMPDIMEFRPSREMWDPTSPIAFFAVHPNSRSNLVPIAIQMDIKSGMRILSVSAQDEPSPESDSESCAVIGYPSGHDGARYLARSRLPAVSRKKIVLFCYVINPLLTTLIRSGRLDIGLVLFVCVFYGPRIRLVHKNTNNELGQYPCHLDFNLSQ